MLEVVAVVVPVVMALIFTKAGVDMVRDVEPTRATSARLGIDERRFGMIGVLQLLGAVGLLVGLAWWPLGVAAAAGLILLMLGAIVTHVRVGDPAVEVAPALVCLAGAAGAAALFFV